MISRIWGRRVAPSNGQSRSLRPIIAYLGSLMGILGALGDGCHCPSPAAPARSAESLPAALSYEVRFAYRVAWSLRNRHPLSGLEPPSHGWRLAVGYVREPEVSGEPGDGVSGLERALAAYCAHQAWSTDREQQLER